MTKLKLGLLLLLLLVSGLTATAMAGDDDIILGIGDEVHIVCLGNMQVLSWRDWFLMLTCFPEEGVTPYMANSVILLPGEAKWLSCPQDGRILWQEIEGVYRFYCTRLDEISYLPLIIN